MPYVYPLAVQTFDDGSRLSVGQNGAEADEESATRKSSRMIGLLKIASITICLYILSAACSFQLSWISKVGIFYFGLELVLLC